MLLLLFVQFWVHRVHTLPQDDMQMRNEGDYYEEIYEYDFNGSSSSDKHSSSKFK